jgi:hypothetical protein
MLNNNYSLTPSCLFFKKYLILLPIKIKVFTFKNKKILILKKETRTHYFIYPGFLDIIYKNNYLHLAIKSSTTIIKYKALFFFLSQFITCLKQLNKTCSITFLIRGVGLKINLLNSLILSLKLGYSHLISLLVPKTITISIFKKKVILCCYNKITLGNFGNIVYKYRPINIFTGKGLFKKKSFLKLKEYTKKI